MQGVDREKIVTGLRDTGVRAGGLLLVHASLSSLGRVEGGAATVVAALLEAVGPQGSVFAPTFNFGQLAFDAATTRSLTGVVSESLRTWPRARRSLHPTHPVSGVGPAASRVLAEHPLMEPFGRSSPLWRLWEDDATVLLLGCDHRSSSMIHVAEEAAGVAYLKRTRLGRAIENGVEREIVVTRPPCSKGFNAVDAPLREAGKIREGWVGEARVMCMRASDIIEAAMVLLAEDRGALLCKEADCVVCPESRRMIEAAEV